MILSGFPDTVLLSMSLDLSEILKMTEGGKHGHGHRLWIRILMSHSWLCDFGWVNLTPLSLNYIIFIWITGCTQSTLHSPWYIVRCSINVHGCDDYVGFLNSRYVFSSISFLLPLPYIHFVASFLPFENMSMDFLGLTYFKAYEIFSIIIIIIKNDNLSGLMADPHCLQNPPNG